MNNIQEKDWAEDDWSGSTGMDSSSEYCTRKMIDDNDRNGKNISTGKPVKQHFEIKYELRRRGIAEIIFSIDKKELVARASYFSDPLLDLTETAIHIQKGVSESSVVFMGKTGEHHLVLQRQEENQLSFEIRWFEKRASWGQVPMDCYVVSLKGNTTVDDYCLQILNILSQIDQKLGPHQYKKQWINAEFPSEAYSTLKKLKCSLVSK